MTDERDKTTNEETLEGKEEATEEETTRRRKEKANRKRKKQRKAKVINIQSFLVIVVIKCHSDFMKNKMPICQIKTLQTLVQHILHCPKLLKLQSTTRYPSPTTQYPSTPPCPKTKAFRKELMTSIK